MCNTDCVMKKNARDYALYLVDNEIVDVNDLLMACLKYMSNHQIEDMLHANALLMEEDFDEYDEE